ncbi:MAG: hypothetical protein Q4G04_02065 [bacterium]|nr:hypothetical protein [bacterium]
MNVIMIYMTFIMLLVVLMMIMMYFLISSFRKKTFSGKVLKQVDELKPLFKKYLNNGKKDIKGNDLEELKKIVSNKNGLEAFTICYLEYREKLGDDSKLESFGKQVIDYDCITNNKVVREKYRDSYVLYLLAVYKLNDKQVIDYAFEMLDSPSIYTRNNALRVIENSISADDYIKTLKFINEKKYFFNNKLLIDFLTFNKCDRLDKIIIKELNNFDVDKQKIIIDYLTAIKSDEREVKETLNNVLTNENNTIELELSILKYFEVVKEERIVPCLLKKLSSEDWRVKAISCKVSRVYPTESIKAKLRECLVDKNWFVRYNAAFTLVDIDNTFNETELAKLTDDFAKDITTYALSKKKMEKGVARTERRAVVR